MSEWRTIRGMMKNPKADIDGTLHHPAAHGRLRPDRRHRAVGLLIAVRPVHEARHGDAPNISVIRDQIDPARRCLRRQPHATNTLDRPPRASRSTRSTARTSSASPAKFDDADGPPSATGPRCASSACAKVPFIDSTGLHNLSNLIRALAERGHRGHPLRREPVGQGDASQSGHRPARRRRKHLREHPHRGRKGQPPRSRKDSVNAAAIHEEEERKLMPFLLVYSRTRRPHTDKVRKGGTFPETFALSLSGRGPASRFSCPRRKQRYRPCNTCSSP